MPKEITGYACDEAERRRCASMLRLLLEAHTVQNFSLKEGSDELVAFVVAKALGESIWPSRADGFEDDGGDSAGGGGGGGG